MSIKQKAQELGEEIVSSSEYKELKSAEAAVYEDDQASEIMENYQSLQKRLQMAQANGQQINQKQQQQLQGIQAKMQENEKIRDFIEAQKAFNKVMETVNQVISDYLQDQQEQPEPTQ